jgi:sarcosine oxidase subunit gamma
MARRSTTAAEIGRALGMTLPEGPHATRHGPLTILGTGPSTWLAISEEGAGDWFDRLHHEIGPIASLSDQSSGYVVWRLSGAFARTLLQRGAAIDFHPGVFKPGSVATTMIAHIGVIIWQVDDEPTYDIALFRSFATSFRRWLDVTAPAI